MLKIVKRNTIDGINNILDGININRIQLRKIVYGKIILRNSQQRKEERKKQKKI